MEISGNNPGNNPKSSEKSPECKLRSSRKPPTPTLQGQGGGEERDGERFVIGIESEQIKERTARLETLGRDRNHAIKNPSGSLHTPKDNNVAKSSVRK